MLVRTLSAVSIAALLASPALAQSTTTPSTAPAKPPMAQPATPPAATPSTSPSAETTGAPQFIAQYANEWRGSEMIGEDVVGADNKSIGEINDVLIDSSGMIKGVVIGVGGFLGIGEKNVAVPFSALRIEREKDDPDEIEKISVTYTKQQLEQAPAFKFAGDAPRANTGSGTTAPKR